MNEEMGEGMEFWQAEVEYLEAGLDEARSCLCLASSCETREELRQILIELRGVLKTFSEKTYELERRVQQVLRRRE